MGIHMSDEKILRIEDELYGGYDTIHNPVSDYWDIQLYLHKDSKASFAFIVKFTSMLPIELPNGENLTQAIFINEENFEDKERTIRKKLRKIGIVNDIIFRGIKEYVQYLKMNKQYTYLENETITTTIDEEQTVEFSSKECYQTLLRYIEKNPYLFPISREEFRVDMSKGIVISAYKKKECKALAITGENLQDIIGIVEKSIFENVMRDFKVEELLLSGSKDRMTSKFTFTTNYRANAYIIKIDPHAWEQKED